MAFCRLVLPILALSIVSCYANINVPVFLWGDLKTSIKSNALTNVGQEEFKAILEEKLETDPFTVIFIEETLSVEDFSRKNDEGETSFPYLHSNIGRAGYFPSVQEAIDVLNNIADPEKVDRVKLTENGLSAEFVPESVKILFITLKDAREGESRSDMLRRHNDFMEDMFTKLKKQYGNVVGVYTAEFPSWTIPESHSRVRRQAEVGAINQSLDGLKLFVEKITLTVGRQVTNLDRLESTSSSLNKTDMATTLNFGDNSLVLNFLQQAGYWYFSSVILKQATSPPVYEELYPEPEVYALAGFSYRCGQNITFENNGVNQTQTYTVRFENLKVQPFFNESGNATLVFGDSLNCVGFFSVPIWSGLFVVFILLSITFYGILMMLDIRTMDRFDDPKGKTITISAVE